jgi:hypothetical protein
MVATEYPFGRMNSGAAKIDQMPHDLAAVAARA